jgi:hypothetical protein
MNEAAAPRPIQSYVAEALLCTLVVGVLFLYPQSHFGYSTRILDLGDEGLLWYVSQRTALGQVPLRDFFSYDPGRYYWSALIFKLLRGDGLFEQIIADDIFGLIAIFVTYLVMCRSAIDRRWRIAAVLLLGITLGFPRHKIYEQALSLISVAGVTFVLARPSSKRWFYYGLATGNAAFIGRNSGLYFGIAAILTFGLLKFLNANLRAWRALGAYALGSAIGYLPMLVMVIAIPGFVSALWRSVVLNSKQLIPVPVPFPWRLHALGLYGLQPLAASFLFILAPLTYALLLLLLPRLGNISDQSGERRLACGASIAGIPYLLHGFSHATFGHLSQATLPFVVASIAFSAYLFKTGKRYLSLSVALGLTGLVLACWLPREPIVEYLRARDLFQPIRIESRPFLLPGADVQVMRAAQVAFDGCGARDGSFLASPDYPALYAFLETRSPFWEVYFILFRLPRSEESQTRHIDALIQNRTAVILLTPSDEKAMRVVYPRLLDYILTHYQPMNTPAVSGDFQIYYMPEWCGK